MELSGKVIKLLETQQIVSKKNGKTYLKHSFVLETQEQYPKKVVMTVMGEGMEKWNRMGIVEGGSYNVSFDIDAHEYNGKWYNEVSAWKAVNLSGNANNANANNAAPQVNPNNDDVPF